MVHQTLYVNPLAASPPKAIHRERMKEGIVGRYSDAQTAEHGFLFRDGQFTTIDFPGALTHALGINNAGHVVGRYSDDSGNHGFLHIGGNFTTIDPPGSVFTEANGINDAGEIVGAYFDSGGSRHGFLLSANGEFVTIDVDFPGAFFITVFGINNSGLIVGAYVFPPGAPSTRVYRNPSKIKSFRPSKI